MAFRHYAESIEIITPTVAGSWTEYDLIPHGIPPSAVLEVAINNLTISVSAFGGVRATSGTLDRRIDIVRSVDGDSFCTMHVQVDSNSKIDYYAENITNIQFNIIGYWVGCEYFERFDNFTLAASTTWESKALDIYGISDNQIVDVLITNTDTANAREIGIRASGSTRTRLFDLSRSAGIGESCLTQWVEASGVNAAIDVYAEDNTKSNIYILGYLNIPPGDYTESDVFLPEPSVDATWETLDIGSSGIPNNSVVGFTMGQDVSDNQFIGVRNTSSSDDRFVNLEESFEAIGLSWVQMHVNVDSGGNVQHYASDISPDEPQFIVTNYWDNLTSSSEPFIHNNLLNLFIQGRDPFVHYTEADPTTFNVTTIDTWQEYDLQINRFVPVSTNLDPVVAEIVIGNQSASISQSGGIRSIGSSLDRKFGLRPATGNGFDLINMLVPVSSDGKIEIYGSHTTFVDFRVVGYWIGAIYIETFEEFNVGADNIWTNVNLGTAYASTVADVMISNANTIIQQSGGIRQVGSSLNRYHSLSPGVTNFPDHVGLSVNTSGVSGTIQGYATTDADIILTAMGKWSFVPGIYNEVFAIAGDTTSNSTWQVKNIGLSDGDIVEMVIEHRDNNNERDYGCREVGSNFNRIFTPRQTNITPTDTAADTYRILVNVIDQEIELYTSLRSDAHNFMKVGYWDSLNLIPNEPITSTGNFDLYISGTPPVTSGNHDLYINGTLSAQIIADFDLFLKVPEPINGQFPLFIESSVTFDSSGNHPSGLEMFVDGHELASGSIDMFMIGPVLSDNQISLYTQAGSFDNIDLFMHGLSTKARIRDLFIKGPEFITTSGNFVYPLDPNLFTTPSGGQSPNLFIKGPEKIISSGDFLYPGDSSIFISPSGGKSPDLFMKSHLPLSKTMTLYIGPLQKRQSWTLYIKTESSTANDSINLFIHGFIVASGQSGVNQAFNNSSLYLEAIDADFPYTSSGTPNWSMFLRVGSGNLTDDHNWSMFLKADTTTSGSFSLVTYGHASGSPPHGNEFNNSIDFVCSVDPSDLSRIGFIPHTAQDPWTLFIRVKPGLFNTKSLFISGASPITLFASGDLFIQGLFGQQTDTIPLYILGISGIVNNGPSGLSLFLDAVIGVYNTSRNMYLHGF